MSSIESYEDHLIQEARKAISKEEFASALGILEYNLTLQFEHVENRPTIQDSYNVLVQKNHIDWIWFLDSGEIASTSKHGKKTPFFSVAMLRKGCIVVARFEGEKSNHGDFTFSADVRNRWTSGPRLCSPSLTVIPLASIDHTSVSISHKDMEVVKEGYAHTWTVEKEPDYLGAALVGGAVGGTLGAVAAMKYEEASSGTKVTGVVVKPEERELNSVRFSISGPIKSASLQELERTRITIRRGQKGQPSSALLSVPKSKNIYDDYAGMYNLTIADKSSSPSVLSSLKMIADLSIRETKVAIACNHRRSWFDVDFSVPLGLDDQQLETTDSGRETELFELLKSNELSSMDARLKSLRNERMSLSRKVSSDGALSFLPGERRKERMRENKASLAEVESKLESLAERYIEVECLGPSGSGEGFCVVKGSPKSSLQSLTGGNVSRARTFMPYYVAAAFVALGVVAILVYTLVILPSVKDAAYHDAEALMEAGDFVGATMAYRELGDYKDSSDMAREASVQARSKLFGGIVKGDTLELGTYEQDNDTSNGSEPIEWLVLDVQDDRVLLISQYALCERPYCDSRQEDNSWQNSSLRQWLSADFKDSAFTDAECSLFLAEAPFCLDESEARRFFATPDSRICMETAYASAKGDNPRDVGGDYHTSGGATGWWLRQEISSDEPYYYCAPHVSYEGEVVSSKGNLNLMANHYCSVRPAIWVYL